MKLHTLKLYVSSEEKGVEQSKELELPNKTVDVLSAQDGQRKFVLNFTTDIEGGSVAAPIYRSKTKDFMSNTQELGEKFENCISRMEGSFVKAIQDLSKTQNEIFGRVMSSIRDESLSFMMKLKY